MTFPNRNCEGVRPQDVEVSDVTTEWLTANEAAQYLKVQHRTVLKWAKEGRIPAHSLSGLKRVTWRFLKSELDAMLASPSAARDWRTQ